MRQPHHLGDGAYISEGTYPGEVILTAGHHDPEQATNVVYLDPTAVAALLHWLGYADLLEACLFAKGLIQLRKEKDQEGICSGALLAYDGLSAAIAKATNQGE